MPNSLTQLISSRVDNDDFTLPVFSPVAMEIQNAIRSNSEFSTIEKIILKDQSLVTEVLRLANSALFSGLSKQKTIQQSLVRLGVKKVFNVVMMAAQEQTFIANNPNLNQLMKVLWEHAAASAAACRWVAEKCGYQNLVDDAFLAGLLHDLGSLMVLKALDEITSKGQIIELTPTVIMEVIDSLHSEFGYRVMSTWELPPMYAEIARDHHLEKSDSSNFILQIVRLVDVMCRKVGIGLVHEPELVLESLDEVTVLGIKSVHLAELEIELEDIMGTFK